MTINTEDILNSILESISRIDYVKADEIPNIDLYMDQVTTFMNDHMKSSKRYEDDKILTKTMINNYAKNELLPPPLKKKYSKEHVMVLIFIYYLKIFYQSKILRHCSNRSQRTTSTQIRNCRSQISTRRCAALRNPASII